MSSEGKELQNNILEVRNLSVHFASRAGRRRHVIKAVDDISFFIQRGETFGLVGESGCGKTTTGRTIIRLGDPTAGSIKYDGVEISGRMNKRLRKYLTDNMAMVFQDPIESLNPRMTVEEIVSEGLRVRGQRDKGAIRAKVLSTLHRVGLSSEHATRYPHEFSGGQRQRIGIARAIITNPAMIIADEPVSALDVSIQAQVINLLKDLQSDFGLTILFIAHDLSVVKHFSDRIGVMYFGKIVEIADSEDLYRNPVHPYTRALLSSIPKPNPIAARAMKRTIYNPETDHDYTSEKPAMHEIWQGHLVWATRSEVERYRHLGGPREERAQ